MSEWQPPARWVKRLERALWRYRNDRDYDDLIQEGVIAMWQTRLRRPEEEEDKLLPLAVRSALNAVGNYLWKDARRYERQGRLTWIEQFPTDAAETLLEEDEPDHYRGVEPDFVPALLERLALEELFQRQRIKPEQRLLLLYYYGWGMTLAEIGGDLGLSFEQVRFRLHRAACELLGRYGEADKTSRRLPYHAWTGVRRRYNRWQATYKLDGRLLILGSFDTAAEAALAYDAAVLCYGGQKKRQFNLLPEECRK